MTSLKFLKRYFLLLLLGISVCPFIACEEDDDEDDTVNVGEVVPGSGKKLLSADDYQFYYSPDGKLTHVALYESQYDFSSNKITYYFGGEEFGVITLFHNKKGLITKMYNNESWEEDGNGSCAYMSTYNMSYDREGHLTEIAGNHDVEFTFEGETEYEEYADVMTFTWNDGLLTKYEYVFSSNVGDWESGEIVTFEYDGMPYMNRHRQYTSLGGYIFGGYLEICAYMGLLGTWSEYLPTSLNYTFYYSEDDRLEEEDEETCTFTYEFNSDGTIQCENGNEYMYGTVAEQGKYERQTKSTRAGQLSKVHPLLAHRIKSRR